MDSKFIQIAKLRHSVYHLGRNVNASQSDVIKLIEAAVKAAPTPFNNQSVRAVIAVGKAQDQLWGLIHGIVQKIAGPKKFPKMFAPKIHSFKQGYGTVLFYTDVPVVERTAKKFNAFPKQNFLEWAEQAQGNAQSAVWDALAEQKIGASIHHYASLLGQPVADAIANQFNVPSNWRLRTEMVFGSIEKPAHAKDQIPDQKRFKVFK